MAKRTLYVPEHLNKAIDEELVPALGTDEGLNRIFCDAAWQRIQQIRATKNKDSAA